MNYEPFLPGHWYVMAADAALIGLALAISSVVWMVALVTFARACRSTFWTAANIAGYAKWKANGKPQFRKGGNGVWEMWPSEPLQGEVPE